MAEQDADTSRFESGVPFETSQDVSGDCRGAGTWGNALLCLACPVSDEYETFKHHVNAFRNSQGCLLLCEVNWLCQPPWRIGKATLYHQLQTF